MCGFMNWKELKSENVLQYYMMVRLDHRLML